MESRKNDIIEGKLRWDLLPLHLVENIVKVYTFGSRKYGDNTWQNLPDGENRYFSALMRHLVAHRKGELRDPESGLLHMAHACWNAIALLHFALHRPSETSNHSDNSDYSNHSDYSNNL